MKEKTTRKPNEDHFTIWKICCVLVLAELIHENDNENEIEIRVNNIKGLSRLQREREIERQTENSYMY